LDSYSTAASYNAAFLVGVESEFILLKNTNPIEAINPHGWGISQALPSGAKETEVMEEIACALIDSGIELMLYHSESAPGQVGGFNLLLLWGHIMFWLTLQCSMRSSQVRFHLLKLLMPLYIHGRPL